MNLIYLLIIFSFFSIVSHGVYKKRISQIIFGFSFLIASIFVISFFCYKNYMEKDYLEKTVKTFSELFYICSGEELSLEKDTRFSEFKDYFFYVSGGKKFYIETPFNEKTFKGTMDSVYSIKGIYYNNIEMHYQNINIFMSTICNDKCDTTIKISLIDKNSEKVVFIKAESSLIDFGYGYPTILQVEKFITKDDIEKIIICNKESLFKCSLSTNIFDYELTPLKHFEFKMN